LEFAMEKEFEAKDTAVQEDNLPLTEEKTEDIAEQIQGLVEKESHDEAVDVFRQLHPADQGEVLDDLPAATRQQLLNAVPPVEAAEILEHLDSENIKTITESVNDAVLSNILDEAGSDVQADVLRQLPDERSQAVLQKMEDLVDVLPLLRYADDTAGGIMVREYVAVQETATTSSALDTLRQMEPEVEAVHSIFVIDAEGRLRGELGLARLALSRPTTIVGNVMDPDIISVAAETDEEECARVMQRYDLDSLPVVDTEKHLLGIILAEDVIDVISEQATEDMYKLAGIAGDRVTGSMLGSMRKRLPWLTINLATTFVGAAVISIFQSTIARVVMLAAFLPVVAGQGGIGGTQTLTLVVRGMALGEITRRSGLRLLGREALLGIVHGVVLGVLVGIVGWAWKGNYMLGVVLGLAMIGNMFIAGFTGAGVPLILTRLKIDPAVASAVIVTTCTDAFGFLLFLGLATLLITRLL
jgi:magnesium transporter